MGEENRKFASENGVEIVLANKGLLDIGALPVLRQSVYEAMEAFHVTPKELSAIVREEQATQGASGDWISASVGRIAALFRGDRDAANDFIVLQHIDEAASALYGLAAARGAAQADRTVAAYVRSNAANFDNHEALAKENLAKIISAVSGNGMVVSRIAVNGYMAAIYGALGLKNPEMNR